MITRRLAICVAGVPGVGKTTAITAVASSRADVAHVSGSAVLREVIFPATTQQFDRWPPSRRNSARTAAVARLRDLRDSCPGQLLVDGHFSLRDRLDDQLHPVFTTDDMQFYDGLVLFSAPADMVLAWRAADGRRRDSDSHQRLERHLEYEEQQAGACATAMHVPLVIIRATALEQRVALLEQAIDDLRGGC